jgi:hypothetical protein
MNAKRILKETAKVGVAALCLALIAGYTSQLVRPCEKLQRCPGTQGTCPDGQSCNWKLEFRFLGPGHSSVLAWTQEQLDPVAAAV